MAADNPKYPIATASVSYFDPNNANALNIHVFSTDGYTVTERYAVSNESGGWMTGEFNQPGSAVSATAWVDSAGAHVRVYCTFNDGTTEWCLDPGTMWTKGAYTNI
jgi:hypothetical protein